jgi:flagellar motor switch protein FliG
MDIQLSKNELRKLLEVIYVGRSIMEENLSDEEYNKFIKIEEKIINSAETSELKDIIDNSDDKTYDYDAKFKERMFEKYVSMAYDKGVQCVITKLMMNEFNAMTEKGETIEDTDYFLSELYKKYRSEIYDNQCINLKYMGPALVDKKESKKQFKREGNVIHAFGEGKTQS